MLDGILYEMCYGSEQIKREENKVNKVKSVRREGWGMPIISVDAVICNMDLIALIGSRYALPNFGLQLLRGSNLARIGLLRYVYKAKSNIIYCL